MLLFEESAQFWTWKVIKTSWCTHPVSGIIFVNIRWIAERQIQIKLLKYLIFMKSQVQYSKTQFSLLLIHLVCQI